MAHHRRKLRRRQRSCGICRPYKRAGNSIGERFTTKESSLRRLFQKAKDLGQLSEVL